VYTVQRYSHLSTLINGQTLTCHSLALRVWTFARGGATRDVRPLTVHGARHGEYLRTKSGKRSGKHKRPYSGQVDSRYAAQPLGWVRRRRWFQM
jgi:hypothetical protein